MLVIQIKKRRQLDEKEELQESLKNDEQKIKKSQEKLFKREKQTKKI